MKRNFVSLIGAGLFALNISPLSAAEQDAASMPSYECKTDVIKIDDKSSCVKKIEPAGIEDGDKGDSDDEGTRDKKKKEKEVKHCTLNVRLTCYLNGAKGSVANIIAAYENDMKKNEKVYTLKNLGEASKAAEATMKGKKYSLTEVRSTDEGVLTINSNVGMYQDGKSRFEYSAESTKAIGEPGRNVKYTRSENQKVVMAKEADGRYRVEVTLTSTVRKPGKAIFMFDKFFKKSLKEWIPKHADAHMKRIQKGMAQLTP